MAAVVGAGGWTVVDIVLFVCFLIAAPWTVLGFWNAVIGLWLLHGRADGMRQVAPFAAAAEAREPIRAAHRGADDPPQRGPGAGLRAARGR